MAYRSCCLGTDTASTNTGKEKGACKILERKDYQNKTLFHLACCHHIQELDLGTAFQVWFGPTKSPEVSLFKEFKHLWPEIDQTAYQPGFRTTIISQEVAEDIKFCREQLHQFQPRYNYREVLEIIIYYL